MKSSIRLSWHIFKKDVRLLWPFILGTAGVQFALAGVQYMFDRGNVPDAETLSHLYNLLVPATLLSAGFLIAMAVHQDTIPGVRQDWLVRPVKRRDLVLAKLLFVLVMVHGPILLADTFQALVNGFSLSQSLASSSTRGLLLLGFVSLPVLAFASLTQNMTEAVIGAVILFVSSAVSIQLQAGHGYFPTASTGLVWISLCSTTAVLLVGATIIFTMQYFRRKTILSRWLAVCVFALAYLIRFTPWDLAFRLQQRLSAVPGAGGSIVAAYEPSLGKFRLPEGMDRNASLGRGAGTRDEASTVYVPIHVIGLPDHGVLNADQSRVRLLAADDKVLYTGAGDDLLIRKDGQQEPTHFTIGSRSVGFVREINNSDLSVPQNGDAWIYQGIAFPRSLYGHIKSQELRLQIDYSLTLFQGNSYAIPALGGNQVLPGLGRCTTKMDDDGDEVDLHCIQAGPSASCASAYLEHVPSGQRNPTVFSCHPFYAPFLVQYVPDGISRHEAEIRFHDLSGLAKYPVDAAQLPQSRVVIRVYQAQDHFTRQLVIPGIRLSDWESIQHNQVAENR